MRRRKGNRGRPRKVKKGRFPKLRETTPFDSKLCENNSNDQTTSLKSDDAVTGVIGLDKTGPFSYRVGSVNIELEGSEEDIKPVIQENDIMLEVECGSNTASMFLSRLCQGSKGSCIEFDGAWLTPNEFQFVSGRETAKDWKRSIRHFGRSLKLLITKGILTVHPAACRCDSCRLLSSTTNEPKLVKDKRERDLRERASKGGSGSASGSDKEEGGSRASEDDASEEADEESQESGENGDEDSGSEDEEEEGKVEENNNDAGEKESSSSDGSSSSSGSSSSGSESESDDDEKKDEEEEKEENKQEAVAEEPMESIPESIETPVDVTKTVDEDDDMPEQMEVPQVTQEDEGGSESVVEEEEEMTNEVDNDVESKDVDSIPASEEKNDVETERETPMDEEEEENEDEEEVESKVEEMERCETEDTPMEENSSVKEEEALEPTEPSKHGESEAVETSSVCANETEDSKSLGESRASSPAEVKPEDVPTDSAPVVELDKTKQLPEDETSRGSVSSAPSIDSSLKNSDREHTPIPRKLSTPTLPEVSVKKNAERSNSGGGKSRLSNIIDLLRTSKEKETQKQTTPDRPEEKRQETRQPEVKDVKTPFPHPQRREEAKTRKPEREEPSVQKPSREDARMSEKAREAMRLPMGRLPFGFPPPEILERASREAHEQLSKSHRQFEKNLESLITQNMNPFIPELSIFSLPEHRAQLEYNYIKNMERLDQMAKERMASMAEMRHQQLLREHNSFVAKLAEHQKPKPVRPESSEHRNNRESVKKPMAPSKRSVPDGNSSSLPKVPHAHRAMPEVRKDKPDHRTLQTPPAAHHHHPSSRPPSTGNKPPSALPLPASTGRAAHPTGPSATQSRSSPMVAPIAPPLQMWSSCFPYVIPPPTIEMQRLTQFFPNLNGGMFSAETGEKRQTESPILDLSTKKRKIDDNGYEHRSKQAKLSSSSRSVHPPHANGLPRDRHSHKDFSAKDRPMWANFERSGAVACTCALQHLNDIRHWSVEDVCCFLKGLEGCSVYVDTFRRNGIDGNTLLLLTSDTLVKSLGMKVGAATFLTDAVRRRSRELQKLVPCEYCRFKNQKG
ncbi:neurofilament heavy polypeptide-like [Haliotis asinina]|uniref:neurofilament heavy polypeptide-like n=1 Tax=Haliotis asinina TaxID=109174 RepID=UPI0035324289